MAKKIGVLLSGCGVFDGTEVHESVLTLYFLDREGADITCLAPNVPQLHVIDHQTSQDTGEKRNVFVESARISRGNMVDLASVSADDLDGLIIPGGFGAAKNLIDYALKGRDCSIKPDVKRIINDILDAGKPVGAICIAPMVVAVALRETDRHSVLTIGTDSATASDIEYFGAKHQEARVDEIAVDDTNKIVTTPAYMLGPTISDVAKGIEKVVKQVLAWA